MDPDSSIISNAAVIYSDQTSPYTTEAVTNTATGILTITCTPTYTVTVTPTPSPTLTITPTATLTYTVTPTGTVTSTATPTNTPTSTASPIYTNTITVTQTPTSTITLTPRFTDKLFFETHLETRVVTPHGQQFQTLRIFFKSREPAQYIKVRIFNLHSYLVKELSVPNIGNQYLAEWDYRDRHNRIKQGIYIYQIEIGRRAYNGAFVVAE